MSIRSPVFRWGLLIVLICLIAGTMIYDVRESKIEPMPFDSSHLASLGEVSNLRPPMRRLVEAIKAGELLGASGDSYRADLESADVIARGRRTTRYVFFLNPELGGQEYNPGLVIEYQNRFGQIYYVSIVDPEY